MEYLITNFGIEKFKEFYASVDEDFDKSFSHTFNLSVSESNNKFINYINCLGYNDAFTEIIKNVVQDKL